MNIKKPFILLTIASCTGILVALNLNRLKSELFSTGELSSHYHKKLIHHQNVDQQVPNGSILFIGDSITESLNVTNVYPNSINYGIAGDTTVGVLKRLPAYNSLPQSSCIVLAIGVNDMKYRNDDEIISNIRKILNRLPSNVPILVSAILPLDMKVRSQDKHHTSERVKSFNNKLQTMIHNEWHNVHFVDAGIHLKDKEEQLRDEFHIGDGLHLNSKGYQVWQNLLRSSLEEILTSSD